MEFSHLHFIIHTWDFSAVTCLQRQRPTENRHFPSIHYYDLSSQYIKVGPVFSWCIILEQNSSNTKKKSLHDNKISLLTSLHSLVPQCLVQLMVPVTSHKVLPVWEWAATVAVESHIDYTSLTQFPACLCLCVCLFVSIFWARPKKGITAHMTYISACTCPHRHTDVGATPAHERTHKPAHTCLVLLTGLSQYQTSPGLVLWEALRELSGHSDWRKISLQISCGQKIWLMPRRDNGWSSLALSTFVRAQIMSQQDWGECSY